MGEPRAIGDAAVGPVGLGCVNFTLMEPQDEADSIRAIHAALDAGVILFDTALAYTTLDEASHNEALLAKALRAHPRGGDALVATKGGHFRAGPRDWPVDGRPETIRRHCETSLRTLGVDAIALYQLHWPDPHVPVAETMGAFAELRDEGKVRLVGVSNFSIDQLEEALGVVPVASVQNRFSPVAPGDRPVLEHCAAQAIAYLPYSPLGGAAGAKGIGDAVPALAEIGRERGVSPQRVALAWHLAQGPNVIPIPGARRAESIVDSAAAADLALTADELARLP